ncbi:MAG: CDP-alcohol phosphatidyltransferase family protein [Candidatus Omnitrophica bacterium]|nr:CDP-alcohol phosphatidyltransferase family protein [Candidatus Omnitrophota bacterium]
MLSAKYKNFFNTITHRIARVFVVLHVTPNMLTLGSLVLLLVACVILFLTKNLILFCVLVLVFGFFDAFDGALARITNTTSKFGSYLDALVDRYYETIGVLAVAIVKGNWILSFLFLSGCLIISYAKARAAMEVPIENNAWPDFMERLERDLIFIIGLLVSEITGWHIAGRELFFWVLFFLVVATHMTAVQRAFRAKRLIEINGNSNMSSRPEQSDDPRSET